MLNGEIPLQGLRDRVLALRSLPSLAGVDDAALTMVAEHARSRLFRAGEHVLRWGEPLQYAYVILDGRLRLTRKGRKPTTVTRPQGVGMMSVLAGAHEEMEVVAEVDTLTLTLPLSGAQEAFEENFSLMRIMLRNTASLLLARRGNLPVLAANAGSAATGDYPERPMTLVERILQLRSMGIFARCNVDALVAIARQTHEVRLPAGEVLWRIGEPATFWLQIDYGRVRCTSPEGSSVEVGHGFVLGVMETVSQQQRAYEARTETALIASRLDRQSFLPVMEANTDLARGVMANFAQAVLDATDGDTAA